MDEAPLVTLASPQIGGQVELTELANGFRIVTERMEGIASASIGVWVGVGARHETVEENGIAHFLEHMAFKGTERRSALDIAEEIERVGGWINAYTSREITAYYARMLGEDVPLAFDIIADILRHSVFDPHEIEIERGVILQEIGQTRDTPDDIIFDWLQETAFPDQPVGRPILGPPENVRRFGPGDFRAFVARHYRPCSMVLSAAGAVDHDALVRLAEAAFGDMERAAAPRAEPARFAGGERLEEKALEQAHYLLALPVPGYRDPEYITAQLVATALGGGMSSRLFQEIREKRGLCYAIHAQSSHHADSGLLTVYAGTGGEELGELAGLVADEIARAAADFTAEEIDRARAQLRAGMLMGLEAASSRAERNARTLFMHGRVVPPEETLAQIAAVSRDRARDFLAGIAKRGALVQVAYGPVAGALPREEIAARLAGGGGAGAG